MEWQERIRKKRKEKNEDFVAEGQETCPIQLENLHKMHATITHQCVSQF
jgi:hypothetical protein